MTSAPPVRPRRRWVGAMWVGVALVVAVPVLVVAGLWFFVQGGWDGVRPRAEPTDTDVVRARAAAADPQAEAAADLQELAATARAGTSVADPLAAGDLDECFEGWTSWKVDDDYTLRCQVTTAVVLGLPEGADVRASAVALDDALEGAWTPDGAVGLVDGDRSFPSGRYVSTDPGGTDGPDGPDEVVLVVTIDPSYPDGSSLGTGSARRIWTDGSVDDVVAAGAAHAGPVIELRLERTYFVDD